MLNYQYLIEVDALNSSNQEVTLRFCCRTKYVGGGYTWVPGVIDPGLFQVNMFSGSKTYGESKYSYGEIVLNNLAVFGHDGPQDSLASYMFAGRQITMYRGLHTAPFPSGFTTVYTATVEYATIEWTTVSLTLRGRQAELGKAFEDLLDGQKFLGTNTAPDAETGLTGLEGVDTDLKDKTKPVLIGRAFNFAPVCCNTDKLIYAVSPLTGLSALEFKSDFMAYDNGVKIKCEGTATDLETTQPTRGYCLVDKDGYFRLRSAPIGQVTCSAVQRGYGLKSSPANLIKYILNKLTELSLDTKWSDMIDEASFAAYEAKDSYERGVYITGTTKISAIIDQLLSPLGFWYFNNLGKMQLGFLEDPVTMTPIYVAVSDVNITKFSRKRSSSTAGGVPASEVAVNYAKNYTKQTNVATSVSTSRKAWLEEDWRTVSQERTGVANPFEEKLELETALTEIGFVSNVAALYCADREIIDIEIIAAQFIAASAILPGQCVSVDLQDRFWIGAKKMLVVGITTNYVEETVALTLWG